MLLNGLWVGWGLGDHSVKDFTVRDFKRYAKRMYRSYCFDLDDTNVFDQSMQDHVEEIQTRLADDGHLVWGQFILGVLDLPTEYATGFKEEPLPWIITVEGHQSNQWWGPCADTARALQTENRCYWQPTGWANSDIPFKQQSGIDALKENVDKCPDSVDLYIICYSQGAMVVYDYLAKYGIPDNLKAILFYGNPCRAENSIAEWAIPWLKRTTGHGLDPVFRFELPGCVSLKEAGVLYKDVLREGDIFAQNWDDLESQMRAAVYQGIARSKFFGNPISFASLIFKLFSSFSLDHILSFVYYIMMASGSGIVFLAGNPNPHYAPYDITGGKDWLRGLLIKNG